MPTLPTLPTLVTEVTAVTEATAAVMEATAVVTVEPAMDMEVLKKNASFKCRSFLAEIVSRILILAFINVNSF